MIAHPEIDPTAFSVFGWPVHWYGVMYLLSFVAAFVCGRRLLRRSAFGDLRRLVMDEMLLAGVLGVIGGGRLGYVLFYKPAYYAGHPLEIFAVWDGGMSFHGGLLGVIFALFWYARRSGLPFLRVVDFAAVLTPFGLGLGRIGNFINGELPGRIASPDLPWAMIFPGDSIARHPSPLYQAALEGGVLCALMFFFAVRRRAPGFLSGVFLIGYAMVRMFSEFFREPDSHLGFVIGNFSMGQLLSLPMLLGGIALLTIERWTPAACRIISALAKKRKESDNDNSETIPAAADSQNDSTVANAEPELNGDANLQSIADSSQTAEYDSDADVEYLREEENYDSEEDSEFHSSAADSPAPWWKKMFAAKETEIAEESPRRRSRRETRRHKKKKRRR